MQALGHPRHEAWAMIVAARPRVGPSTGPTSTASSPSKREPQPSWASAWSSLDVAPVARVLGGGEPPVSVTIIMVMSETLPLAQIKAHLSEIVDRSEREHERVVLTRNGRPAAVIMSPADLEALEDTLELLSDARALKEIKAAREDIAKGRVVRAGELRAKYLRK